MCLSADLPDKAAKAHSQLNQPFFNIIAPGHSAAAINNSPIQQFTH
jgi:hypothetical protein